MEIWKSLEQLQDCKFVQQIPNLDLYPPKGLCGFSRKYDIVELFHNDPESANAWKLGPTSYLWSERFSVLRWAYPDFLTLPDDPDVKARPELSYLRNCQPLGISINLDSIEIGVDNITGKIFIYSRQKCMEGGGFPVIAMSFDEWIENVLKCGSDSQIPFWEMEEFVDLGPLIPNDPIYCFDERFSW